MCIESRFIMEPYNSIPDICHWHHIKVFIKLEMNVIIGPNMHALLELVPSRQEDFLPVFHHIFTFMAILVLSLWLLSPVIPQQTHPMLCGGQADWLGKAISLLDIVVLGKFNYILSASILANTLEMNLDLIRKLFVIDMGFSFSIIVHWEFLCLDIFSC